MCRPMRRLSPSTCIATTRLSENLEAAAGDGKAGAGAGAGEGEGEGSVDTEDWDIDPLSGRPRVKAEKLVHWDGVTF